VGRRGGLSTTNASASHAEADAASLFWLATITNSIEDVSCRYESLRCTPQHFSSRWWGVLVDRRDGSTYCVSIS